jgi:hypothetical protein
MITTITGLAFRSRGKLALTGDRVNGGPEK